MPDTVTNNQKRWWVVGLIAAVLLTDQAIKIWVKTHMAYGEMHPIMGADWAFIHFVENDGMAFGRTFNFNNGKLLLSLFRLGAAIFLFFFLRSLLIMQASRRVLLSFALIFAGAVGNIIDSAFYGMLFSASSFHSYGPAVLFPEGGGYAGFLHGKVVDMFYFPMWKGHYPDWLPLLGGRNFTFFSPVFNLADVSISIGVVLVLLFYRKDFASDKKQDIAEIEPDVSADF